MKAVVVSFLLLHAFQGGGPVATPATTRNTSLPAGAFGRLGNLNFRHDGPVASLQYSPDGTRIASASADGTARVWDAKSGEELLQLRGHEGAVSSVAWSPDGAHLATAGSDKTSRLWNSSNGSNIRTFEGHTWPVETITFSPDGRTLATGGGDRTIRIWNVYTGEELYKFEGHTQIVSCVAFSPDGRRLASASGDRTIKIWNIKNGRVERELGGTGEGCHTHMVYGIAWMPDGDSIVSVAGDSRMRIFNVQNNAQPRIFEGHDGIVMNVATVRGASQGVVSVGTDGRLLMHHAKTGRKVIERRLPHLSLQGLAVSPAGDEAVFGGVNGSIYKINPTNGEWIHDVTSPHHGAVRGLLVDNIKDLIITGDAGGNIVYWGSPQYKPLHMLQCPHPVVSMMRGQGRTFVSIASGEIIAIDDDERVPKIVCNLDQPPGSLLIAPSGRLLATGGSRQCVQSIDPLDGTRSIIEGVDGSALNIAMSPDGHLLASGGVNRMCTLWDLNTSSQVHRWNGQGGIVHAVLFTSDGMRVIVAGGDRVVHLYDVKTKEDVVTFSGHTKSLRCVALSPDGKWLAAGGEDRNIYIWCVESGTLLKTLPGHRGTVLQLAFDPDNGLLFSSSEDSTVLIWKL